MREAAEMTADKRGKLGQQDGVHYSLFYLRGRLAGRTQTNKHGKARRITILQSSLASVRPGALSTSAGDTQGQIFWYICISSVIRLKMQVENKLNDCTEFKEVVKYPNPKNPQSSPG